MDKGMPGREGHGDNAAAAAVGIFPEKTSKPAQHAQQQRKRNVMDIAAKKQKNTQKDHPTNQVFYHNTENVQNCSPRNWDHTRHPKFDQRLFFLIFSVFVFKFTLTTTN